MSNVFGSLEARLDEVSCIVVHHHSCPTVLTTVADIEAGGVPPSRILVVDNSEDEIITTALSALLPNDVHYLAIENRGYANAVNRGLSALAAQGGLGRFILVSTHEARPAAGAIAAMRDALLADERRGVAGPTLLDLAHEQERVWSTGGELSRILRVPEHPDWGLEVARLTSDTDCVERDWLDGSFCMYRTDALMSTPLDESYFLYFEETDCHVRLGSAGWTVVWVPGARVGQSSKGIPAYYLGKNLNKFLRAHGRPGLRGVALSWVLTKLMVRRGLGMSNGPVLDYVRGWREAVLARKATESTEKY